VEATHRLKVPEPSSHPVDVGLRTETAILAELVQRGYHPFTEFQEGLALPVIEVAA
jgi:hypothetical protein